MPLEFWSTVASLGTFIVIAATAVAAVVQLRHMRSANKVAAIQAFIAGYDGTELREAFHIVRTELAQRLQDPAFRQELRRGVVDRLKHPEIQVCNFFDQWGLYYRDGVIDKDSFMRVNAGLIVRFWELLEAAVAVMADPVKGNQGFQQFEFLTVQARRWLERHPEGDYPKGEQRIPLNDPWRKIDGV
jgi:hypothetical protein